MKVVNTAVSIPQMSENDSRERTVKEIFVEFNEQLFWSAENKYFTEEINKFDQNCSSHKHKESNMLFNHFEKILSNDSNQGDSS